MTECRAVILYGSHARGDTDDNSDIDVLVAASAKPRIDEIIRLLPESSQGPLHVSHYSWSELCAMSRYGSLFLHHIASESVALLYQGDAELRMSTLLQSLRSYKLADRDLIAFRSTIDDVEMGLAVGLPPCFELAVLGGVARHASVLACYLAGTPTFGRNSMAMAVETLGMPGARQALEFAHLFRLYEQGQCAMPFKASRADVERVVGVLRALLYRTEEMIHADGA